MKSELEKRQQQSVFATIETFETAQRVAKMLATSSLVPKEYQNNIPNTMIALEMAHRTGSSPIMVMQNLDIIQGKPSWASKFVISALNSCGRFTPLRFKYEAVGEKTIEYMQIYWENNVKKTVKKTITIQDMVCTAISKDKSGKMVEGQEVSLEMAVKEGWYTKAGSKWPTMSKLMLSYRAAKFFGNLYAPDVLMGMYSSDEIQDIIPETEDVESTVVNLNEKFSKETDAEEDEDLI